MAVAGVLQGRRLLVVEDEYFIADDLVAKLEDEGALIVGPAGTVGDALKLIDDAEALDGAVVDLNLRGELAYAVVDALRARHVPLVLSTGYGRGSIPADYDEVVRLGKSIDAQQIATALFG